MGELGCVLFLDSFILYALWQDPQIKDSRTVRQNEYTSREDHIAVTVVPIIARAAYHAELRFIESPLLLPACFLCPLLREYREVAVTPYARETLDEVANCRNVVCQRELTVPFLLIPSQLTVQPTVTSPRYALSNLK